MRVLLDTNIALLLLRQDLAKRHPKLARRLAEPATFAVVSVASLWEIVIKTRLGKLDPGMPLEDVVGFLKAIGLSLLPIDAAHVVAIAEPAPQTRDPFDRLLLAQCQVEGLKMMTLDRVLRGHRLALQAG
jgi:PIN domain nuclease of toxin-antitoxin system